MATSKNSSSNSPVPGSPLGTTGSGSKGKGKSKSAEGRSAEGKSAEILPGGGSGPAKPLPKAKSKGGPQDASPGAAMAKAGIPTATALEADASRPGGSGTAGGAGAASPAGGASAKAGARLSDWERQRRIAEAAYRRAQERGFTGDRHLDDWLEAEREVDEGSADRQ